MDADEICIWKCMVVSFLSRWILMNSIGSSHIIVSSQLNFRWHIKWQLWIHLNKFRSDFTKQNNRHSLIATIVNESNCFRIQIFTFNSSHCGQLQQTRTDTEVNWKIVFFDTYRKFSDYFNLFLWSSRFPYPMNIIITKKSMWIFFVLVFSWCTWNHVWHWLK